MNTDSALELLRRGRPLAVSLVPRNEGFLAWAGVYPLDPSKPSTAVVLRRLGATTVRSEQRVFRVRVIEVNESLLRSEACISEEDLHSREDRVVFGEEALMQELTRLGVPQDGLELPDKVNYPI
ncbi:hypothetical protein JY651_21640 [Pyxidicoccus parkwayensis]|uniref:Uncharacterized protein n=1 Tax=Pyxidicoccus parkwayensis TaxID=2813578 RepID=A0ABX7PA28_9BACT|nr:hypothetical protein [Pyxidicoccus parkwaysis]QSQ27349.1 hypothetical protein JY651_21640 [Pyxidicoccus parkwaysis]